METNSIYGDHLPEMKKVMNDIMSRVGDARKAMSERLGMDPVEHCLCRIKSEESMREKCRRRGLPETTESALTKIYDSIGIRIVCAFIDDVYAMVDYLKKFDDVCVAEEKDYIKRAKKNGYRSYHMILKTASGYYVEIQLRTISMDTWAALEHHLKYKKDIKENQDLIADELKRCADELASTDLSMQIIRNMIMGDLT
ncbi:MAG: GTP pyrophosphokinase family protein [Lachnospiraceae bacterium]|nr:GTP pyrophosphokinase family protein [Lachnospiraceae bacterium]